MVDSKFVLNYLNNIYLFTGTEIKYKYFLDEEPLNLYQLIDNLKYSLHISDIDGKPISEFIHKWYMQLKKEATDDVLDFIKFKYKIILGSRNWEIIDFKGKKFKINDLELDLNKKYDENFLNDVINDWFDNEIIRLSEKMILTFD